MTKFSAIITGVDSGPTHLLLILPKLQLTMFNHTFDMYIRYICHTMSTLCYTIIMIVTAMSL